MNVYIRPRAALRDMRGNIYPKGALTAEAVAKIAMNTVASQPEVTGRQLAAGLAQLVATQAAALTVGDALIDALLISRGAGECDGREKLRRWRLAERIAAVAGPEDELEITGEDARFLAQIALESYNAGVGGALNALLGDVADL